MTSKMLTLIGAHPYDDYCHSRLFDLLARLKPEVIFVEDSKSNAHPCYYNQEDIQTYRVRGFDPAPFRLESPCRMYMAGHANTKVITFPALKADYSLISNHACADVAYDMTNCAIEGKIPPHQMYHILKSQHPDLDPEVKNLEARVRQAQGANIAVVVPFFHLFPDAGGQTLYERLKDLSPERYALKPAKKEVPVKDKKTPLRERVLEVISTVVDRISDHEVTRMTPFIELCTLGLLSFAYTQIADNNPNYQYPLAVGVGLLLGNFAYDGLIKPYFRRQ